MLALIARGRTNREIGDRLFISQKTVGVHVGNILSKLGVSGRVEAAAVAIRLGLEDGASPAGRRFRLAPCRRTVRAGDRRVPELVRSSRSALPFSEVPMRRPLIAVLVAMSILAAGCASSTAARLDLRPAHAAADPRTLGIARGIGRAGRVRAGRLGRRICRGLR